MIRLAAIASMSLVVMSIAGRSAPTPRHAPMRNFVWLRGTDTFGRESFTRSGDAISGDLGSETQGVHYEGHLASRNEPGRFDLRTTNFHQIIHDLTVVLRDDSALVIEHSTRHDDTVRVASKPNAIPMLNSPVGLLELVVERAFAQKTPKADVPVLNVSLDNPADLVVVPFTIAFPSRDSAVLSLNGNERIRFAIDASGRILGAASPQQQLRIVQSAEGLTPDSAIARLMAAPAAQPKDVESADAIIAALYEANSVMVDQKRDADRFRSLYAPDARLSSASHGLRSTAMMTRTVDEYVKAASSGPPRGGFREREIARTSDSFGSIMHVFSTYESRRNPGDTHPTRGINSIQLFNDGHRWWVTSVLWDTERANTPIPAVYLESRAARP
jgi:hypothetical protein